MKTKTPLRMLLVVDDYHEFGSVTNSIMNLEMEHLELGTESSGRYSKYVGVIFEKGHTPTDKEVSKLILDADIQLDEE